MRKYVVILVLSVVVAFAFNQALAFSEMPTVGTAAPGFKLTTNEGKEARNGLLRDEWLAPCLGRYHQGRRRGSTQWRSLDLLLAC